MPTASLLGRPPERTGHIVRELRARITRGDLAPGVQLPTRIEISQQFNASSQTVQRALDELQRDGFIMVKGRQGTFVSSQPPHLTDYALVFPHLPVKMNRFFLALNQEAPKLAREMGRQLSIYYGTEDHADEAEYQRLMRDVEAHRLGGIIFASKPVFLAGTPIIDEPNIPRVAIMTSTPDYPMPQTTTDTDSFWNRCMADLKARGHRKIALLLAPRGPEEATRIVGLVTKQGFEVPQKWVQVISRQNPETARNLMELMFERGRERPDALVIADDNIVEPTLAGMLDAGVKIPTEVEVIAHCNFPYPVPSPVPVRWLGFDVRRVLQACFDDLEGLRKGQIVPTLRSIPAEFEEELDPYDGVTNRN